MKDFSNINLARATSNKLRAPSYIGDKAIHGWDTETNDLGVFVLSRALSGRAGEALHDDGETLPVDAILEYLTHRDAQSSVNVFYNLDFDANVILKGLPKEALYRLYLQGETDYGDYQITYLRKKILSIRKGRKNWEFFDAAQFFFASLQRASETWLGEGKANDGLDVTRFSDSAYVAEHWDAILHYAIRDAELVRDIFGRFARTAEGLGIPCGKPYSTGYLGEQAMTAHFRAASIRKPSFAYAEMQAAAWRSYRGGRFEIIERGAVGEVVVADINSAYPAILASLPDPGSLRWRVLRDPHPDDLEGWDYGVVEGVFSTAPSRPIQPFPVKTDISRFPILHGTPLSIDLETYRFALSRGLVDSSRIRVAYVAESIPSTVYPFAFLRDIYNERLRLKSAGEYEKQLVLKIIINSVYGKLCQVTPRKKLVSETESKGYYPEIALSPHLRDYLLEAGLFVNVENRAGTYYNPFLASHVTALTRLQLLRTILELGLEDDTIAMATDSITVRADAFDGVDFSSYVGGLGAWDVETRGDGFFVGCGVYEIAQLDGTVKTATRGFEADRGAWVHDLGHDTLRGLAEAAGDGPIRVTHHRPLKLYSVIWGGHDLRGIGQFAPDVRGIFPGMDTKRAWPQSDVSWRDLLSGPERSSPLAHLRNPP